MSFASTPASPGGQNSRFAAERAAEATDRANEARQEVATLQKRVDRLEMVCEALWKVVKARTGATEEEALRLIEEIDLRDGKLNGRTAAIPQPCAKCTRIVSALTGICPYCGTQNFKTTVF